MLTLGPSGVPVAPTQRRERTPYAMQNLCS